MLAASVSLPILTPNSDTKYKNKHGQERERRQAMQIPALNKIILPRLLSFKRSVLYGNDSRLTIFDRNRSINLVMIKT